MMNTTANFDESVIQLGVWKNFNTDHTFEGYRLTMKSEDAKVFMAFLVMAVGFIANRSFRVYAFFLHGMLTRFATPRSGSLETRKRQVLIGNAETSGGALFNLLKITRIRARSRPGFVRVLVTLAVVLHWSAFIGLGLLTAYVDRGNLVQSRNSPSCGIWQPSTDLPELDRMFVRNELQLNATLDADAFARECYGGSGRHNGRCAEMVTHSLPFFTEMEECPFSELACTSKGPDSAYALDTGKVSLAQLGFNSKNARKLFIRKRDLCAPLKLEPFLYSDAQKKAHLEQIVGGDIIPTQNFNESQADSVRAQNTELFRMYSHSLMDGAVADSKINMTISRRKDIVNTDYKLVIEHALDSNYSLPALRPQDPNMPVTIITVETGFIQFGQPYQDALFSATDGKVLQVTPTVNYTFYVPLESRQVNSVACQEMAMVCSDISGKCSDWTGARELPSVWKDQFQSRWLKHTDDDVQAMSLAMTLMNRYDLEVTLRGKTGSALQASKFLTDGVQHRIAAEKEQWKAELDSFFQMFLASLQRAVVRTVKIPDLDRARTANLRTPLGRQVCNIILLHADGYRSLSMSGIITILCVAFLSTVLSFADKYMGKIVQMRIFSRFPRFKAFVMDFIAQWQRDGALALLEISIANADDSSTQCNEDDEVRTQYKHEKGTLVASEAPAHVAPIHNRSYSFENHSIPRKPVGRVGGYDTSYAPVQQYEQ